MSQPQEQAPPPDAGTAFAAGVAAKTASDAEERSDEAAAVSEAAAERSEHATALAASAADTADAANAQAADAQASVSALADRMEAGFAGVADLFQRHFAQNEPEEESGPPAPAEKAPPAAARNEDQANGDHANKGEKAPVSDSAPKEKEYGAGWWKW